MTTTADIIRSAARKLAAAPSDESLSAAELDDGLRALNAMLDAWGLDNLFVYQHQLVGPFSTAAGTSAYAVGAAATFNTPRPYKIEGVHYSLGGVKNDLDEISAKQFDSLTAVVGAPQWFYYEGSYPNATLNLWPTPDAAYALYLRVPVRLQQFASAFEDLLMPQGTEEALIYNLAVRLAPEYGVEPSRMVIAMATGSVARLKRANKRPAPSVNEAAYVIGSGCGFNILAGQ